MQKKEPIIPPRLKRGDHIRVVAPAESFSSKFTEEMQQRTIRGLEEIGLKVSFGKYVHEQGPFKAASIDHRLEDIHTAFEDTSVNAVISALGGSAANQLLTHLDYELIKKNAKIFCGLSDITEMNSAIYAKTDLVTYYGPHFTMLGASIFLPEMLRNMQRTFFSSDPFTLEPAEFYSNSDWERERILNEGFWTINEGEAEAQCIGGNLLTLNFLLGYEFVPDIEDKILYLEENKIIDYRGIQKEIQQILNHPQGKHLKGIIIGRFQRESGMSRDLLYQMIKSKAELRDIPVVANVDCSHTAPMYTFPFGGKLHLKAAPNDEVEIKFLLH